MKGIQYLTISAGLFVLLTCPVMIHAEEVEEPEILEEVLEPVETDEQPAPTEIIVEEEISVEDTGLTNDELFEHYVDQQFGIEEETPVVTVKKAQSRSTIPLEGVNNTLYELLVDKISDVAAGNIESTLFEFTDEELNLQDATYTAEELGVEYILNEAGDTLLPEAKTAYYEKIGFDLGLVNKSLLYNHPYELYWYDKSTSGAISQRSSFSIREGLHMTKLSITLLVSADFSSSGAAGTHYMDTESAASVQTAVERAQNIVDEYASYNDYDKLVAYKDAICELASYNDEAAHSSTISYGNPWQMIWVFDGDESTTVVCEGYSKAFDYLCSKSTFTDPTLDCYLISGDMGNDGHMWNIVNIQGKSYMVDVTNCDRGTIGYPDKLFLVGCSNGNVEDGYTFTFGSRIIHYTYDDSMRTIYTDAQLILNPTAYTPAVTDAKHSLALEGNIGVNFFYALSDQVLADTEAKVEFDLEGTTVSYVIKDARSRTISGKRYKAFTMEATSVQMASDINAKVILSNGDTVFEEIYSVKKYCDDAIADSDSETDLTRLMKALLTYGGYAQVFFDHDTDNLAYKDLESHDVSDVTAQMYTPYIMETAGSEEGLTYNYSTLSLDSLTTINHIFTLGAGHTIDEYEFKMGDQVIKPIKRGSRYYVQIPNIASNNLDEAYTITCGGFEIRYSALSYAQKVVSATDGVDDLKSLMQAMYRYNKAADAYFG